MFVALGFRTCRIAVLPACEPLNRLVRWCLAQPGPVGNRRHSRLESLRHSGQHQDAPCARPWKV